METVIYKNREVIRIENKTHTYYIRMDHFETYKKIYHREATLEEIKEYLKS